MILENLCMRQETFLVRIDENFDTICIEYQSNEGNSNESYDYDCGAWATLASHCLSTLSSLSKRNFYQK